MRFYDVNGNTLVKTSPHAAAHINGGEDQVDADRLHISENFTNFTANVGGAASDADDLTAQLRGIDDALAKSDAGQYSVYLYNPDHGGDTSVAALDTTTVLDWNSEHYDNSPSSDMYSAGSPDRITFPVDGIFFVTFKIVYGNLAPPYDIYLNLNHYNSADTLQLNYYQTNHYSGSSSVTTHFSMHQMIKASAGDYVQGIFVNRSGSALTITVADASDCNFAAHAVHLL